MPRLVDPEELAAFVQTHAGHAPLALLLDYDGTLAEIARNPERARLSGPVRAALERLAAQPEVHVGIVTGRSPEGLLEAMGGPLAGVTVAANGGFHIASPDGDWIHPDAARLVPVVARYAATLREATARHPGTQVEDKTLSLAVHYRRAPEAEGAMREAISAVLATSAGAFRLVEGKAALELQPAVAWDKGCAVEVLLERWGIGKNAVFLGDDVIDEPGFEATARRGGIGCRVSAESTPTAAAWRLESVSAVLAFLARLGALRG